MAFWTKLFSRENAPTRIYRPSRGGRGKIRRPLFRRDEPGGGVVKGVSRRVVVVKPPDQSIFEEAIFIVRSDFRGSQGGADALKEAANAAGAYLQSTLGVRTRAVSPVVVCIAAGAVLLFGAAMFLLLR